MKLDRIRILNAVAKISNGCGAYNHSARLTPKQTWYDRKLIEMCERSGMDPAQTVAFYDSKQGRHAMDALADGNLMQTGSGITWFLKDWPKWDPEHAGECSAAYESTKREK